MQVSAVLRQGTASFLHWCPGCQEIHQLPWPDRGWTFDGNADRPTFTPSFKHQWFRKPVATLETCHYVLTAGVLHFQSDCTHILAGQVVPLPELPPELRDPCDWSDG